jgi:hypothetical protein
MARPEGENPKLTVPLAKKGVDEGCKEWFGGRFLAEAPQELPGSWDGRANLRRQLDRGRGVEDAEAEARVPGSVT